MAPDEPPEIAEKPGIINSLAAARRSLRKERNEPQKRERERNIPEKRGEGVGKLCRFVPCDRCRGEAMVLVHEWNDQYDWTHSTFDKCPDCGGLGEVEIEC